MSDQPAITPDEEISRLPNRILRDTQLAFDSVAANYDGPLGNNALIQSMRARTLTAIRSNFRPSDRLLDLGCGTGLDAEILAREGYRITAMDWSAQMVGRTLQRVTESDLQDRVQVTQRGFHQLDGFPIESFDGAYSNLGALNCMTDLEVMAIALTKILKPRGKLIASVIGRVCPWELLLYLSKGQWSRAQLRFARDLVPVTLNEHTVWTHYYAPPEFIRIFSRAGFRLISLRALGLFVPPPYMIGFASRHRALVRFLQTLDDGLGNWPVLRNWGDHFLAVLENHD